MAVGATEGRADEDVLSARLLAVWVRQCKESGESDLWGCWLGTRVVPSTTACGPPRTLSRNTVQSLTGPDTTPPHRGHRGCE